MANQENELTLFNVEVDSIQGWSIGVFVLLGDVIKVDHSELSLNGRAKNFEKSYVFSLNSAQPMQVQGAPILGL